jgi:UDP-glucose 4-epimerase
MSNHAIDSENWLVVGGAGYIGSHLVWELKKHSNKVIIIDDFSTGLERRIDKKVQLINMDVRNTRELTKILNENSIESIVHLAGLRQARDSIRHPTEYWNRNVGSSLSLAEAILQSNVKKILFSSSCSVFGNAGEVNDDSALNPVSPYGRTKLVGEQIFQDLLLEKEMGVGILRYFNVIGSHEILPLFDETSGALLPKIVRAALLGEPIYIHGFDYATKDGTAVRDYIDVRDLAKAHVKVASGLWPRAEPHFFNVSCGAPKTVQEMVDLVLEITKSKSEVILMPRASGDPDQVWSPCDDRLQKLGWRAEIGVFESVKSHVRSLGAYKL